jgi:fructose transport system substrate-binding protein
MSRISRLPAPLLRAAACTGVAALALTACGSGSGSGTASTGSGSVKVGLITKTDTNPFFVKMKEGA